MRRFLYGENSSVSLFKTPFNISFCCALCHIIALVIKLFAAAKPNLYLYARTAEIHFKRNQGNALLLNKAVKLADFAPMHKKAAAAVGVAVKYISLFIGAYVHSVHKNFAVFYVAPAVLQVYLTGADAFDLRTEKLNARFVAVVDKIVVTGFFIFCNGFYAFLLHFSASFRLYFAAFALHKASAFNSAVKGDFVRIFKVAAHGNSVSKAGNLNAHRLYQP